MMNPDEQYRADSINNAVNLAVEAAADFQRGLMGPRDIRAILGGIAAGLADGMIELGRNLERENGQLR